MYKLTDVFDALSALQCYDIDIPKRRRGSARDGGYIFTTDVTKRGDIISFGISGNCDFEYEMAELGHKIYMYDYSVESPPLSHKNFHFEKLKIVPNGRECFGSTSLNEIIRHNGLTNNTNMILKIDIEGSEYGILSSCGVDTLRQFSEIAIEIHWLLRLDNDYFRRKFTQAMSAIGREFILFHVHGNNCSTLGFASGGKALKRGRQSSGLPVADVLELSYIRNDLASRKTNRTFYPTGLDTANIAEISDQILSFYPFIPGSESVKPQLRAICAVVDEEYERGLSEIDRKHIEIMQTIHKSDTAENAIMIAKETILTEEFQGIHRDLDDESYVELLYNSLFSRSPPVKEMVFWVSQLEEKPFSRGDIAITFVNSDEFKNIWES